MRFLKPIGFIAAIGMIVLCFFPWVVIESNSIVITGMQTTGTNFGKPGYLHLVFTALYILLLLVPKVWSRRINLFFTAFNVAWAFRNFILISACYGGECPVKQPALYLLILTAVAMLLVILLAPEKATTPDNG